MCLRRRCGACRPSTGTSRALRSPQAGTVSTWWRGSSLRPGSTSRRTACWCARWATAARRWSVRSRGCPSCGRRTRSLSWPPRVSPVGRQALEALPGRAQLPDEPPLALREAARSGCAELLEQRAPHDDVVQCAEHVLQRAQFAEPCFDGLLHEAGREIFAGVTQALDAHPQRVARLGTLEVDLAQRLAVDLLQPARREAGERGTCVGPGLALEPAQRAEQESAEFRRPDALERGVARGIAARAGS